MNYNPYTEALFECILKKLNDYVEKPHIIYRDYDKKHIKINFLKLIHECPNSLTLYNELVFLYLHPFNLDLQPIYLENMTWASSLVNETHMITKASYKIKRDGIIIYVYVENN